MLTHSILCRRKPYSSFVMTHLVTFTCTQLARLSPFIHRRPKPSFTTKIARSQTATLPQISTKTFPNCHRVHSLEKDAQPRESSKVDSDRRRPVALPEDLSKNVVVLSCESTAEGGVCDVYLVGTCHVSKESSRQVQAIVNFLKPQLVFLELCSSRKSVLTTQNLKVRVPTVREVITTLKKKSPFQVLYGWFLAETANELGVFPGAEFRVAYEEAIKYGGKVILGDRPIQITTKRLWSKTSLWCMTKVLYFLFSKPEFSQLSSGDLNKCLKDLLDSDKLTSDIQEMSKEFPTIMEPLVHERDQYMSSTLLKVASESKSVVAVVGKAHLQGIKKNWKQPVVMKDLMTVPSPKRAISAARVFTSVGVAVAGVAIVSGILRS